MAKHHYLPQHYLKGFIDPASRSNRSPFLWIMDLEDGSLKKRSPKNAASITRYYEWEEADEDKESLEEYFSLLEGYVAPILAGLRGNNYRLSLKERFRFSFFLGLQHARVPPSRNAMKELLEARMRDEMQRLVEDRERLQKSLESFNKSRGDSDALTEEDIRELLGNASFKVTPTRDNLLGKMLEAAFELGGIMFATYWSFFVAKEGEFFTADQPVTVRSPDGERLKIDFDEANNPELEFSFPISPTCCLLMHQKRCPETVFCSKEDVDLINLGMLPMVERYVFCARRDTAIRARKLAQKLGDRRGRREPETS